MQDTINKLVIKEKGILAIDESHATIEKRFASIDLPNTAENRGKYRSLLATTKNLSNYISGVILFNETLTQKLDPPSHAKQLLNKQALNAEDLTIAATFKAQQILIGIKVDQGLIPIYLNSPEKVTKGLDQLTENLSNYLTYGITFAKWRAVINLDPANNLPSNPAIRANIEQLARYAAICQQQGVVPIVEPEVLMDGTHDLATCAKITEKVLVKLFKTLRKYQVQLEYIVLKPNMILPGKNCQLTYSAEEIATTTLTVLKRSVPAAVPSINFLSGGQSEIAATTNLNAINKLGLAPWHLSFSFGRALQETCLKTWQGQDQNSQAAQNALLERSRLNSLANLGIL